MCAQIISSWCACIGEFFHVHITYTLFFFCGSGWLFIQWMKMESEPNILERMKKREEEGKKIEKSDYLIRFSVVVSAVILRYYVAVIISLILRCPNRIIYRSTMWLIMRNLLASYQHHHHHRHQNQYPRSDAYYSFPLKLLLTSFFFLSTWELKHHFWFFRLPFPSIASHIHLIRHSSNRPRRKKSLCFFSLLQMIPIKENEWIVNHIPWFSSNLPAHEEV